ALGVAAVLSIDIVNHSAERAFTWANQTVAGHASDTIVGGPSGLDERIYRKLRVELGLRDAVPFVDGIVRHAGIETRRLRLLGVDVLAYPKLSSIGTTAPSRAWLDLLKVPHSALAEPRLVRELGISVPSLIEVRHRDRRHTLHVIGMLGAAGANEISTMPMLLTDVGTAQAVLGTTGKLSGIKLMLTGTHRDAWLKTLKSRLPASATIIPDQAQGRAMDELTRAFRINLTALSLLALVVGGFLIYNTMVMSVLRRHRQIGTLRSVGATRAQLFVMVTAQALILGGIGTVLGIGIGIGLSHGLLELVVRSINDLYFRLSVAEPHITAIALAKSVALGVIATVIATLAPAYEATRIVPERVLARSDQEYRFRNYARIGLWLGAATMALGAIVLGLPTRSLVAGFSGLFLIIVGFTLSAPRLFARLAGGLERLVHRFLGGTGRVAARGISASLSRSGPAVTALTIAVSATIGVDIMINSFRDTVDAWLRNYLRADIYVASQDQSALGIDPRLVEQARKLPNVRTVTIARWATLNTPGIPIKLFAVELDEHAFANFQFKSGRPEDAWPRFNSEDIVIVSETFAYHRRLDIGDSLTLRTEKGDRRFRVYGIFYDYGTDRGVVVMGRRVYLRHWQDPTITSFAVYVDQPDRLTETLTKLEQLLADTGLVARSNRALRRLSLEIFDRTFTITGVLRWLMMVIAGIGVFSALTAIQLERAREFGVLRALGFTQARITGVVTTETGLMGLIAGMLAIPLGLVMALALIWVINRRAFGWTMQVSPDFESLISGLGLAIVAGVAAGAYPAISLARSRVADALRHE
ncbi:MAG: FtsX-like permease family protein, partial [Gammaproteobacteria bacterium]|nr:FtsX-like permease family protein [Gammaproteobacteria bacterium]